MDQVMGKWFCPYLGNYFKVFERSQLPLYVSLMIKTLLTFKSDIGVLFFSLQRFGFSFGKLLLMVVNHASLMQKSCGILHWWMNVVTGTVVPIVPLSHAVGKICLPNCHKFLMRLLARIYTKPESTDILTYCLTMERLWFQQSIYNKVSWNTT